MWVLRLFFLHMYIFGPKEGQTSGPNIENKKQILNQPLSSKTKSIFTNPSKIPNSFFREINFTKIS